MTQKEFAGIKAKLLAKNNEKVIFMKRRISLVRCFAGFIAATVVVSAFSGCRADSESADDDSITSESQENLSRSESSNDDSTSSDSQGIFSIFEPSDGDSTSSDSQENFPILGIGSSQAYSQPAMWDVLPRIDKTPASNFEYEYDGSLGGMAITNYTGESPEVYIPDTLDGEPVVKADLGNVEITHLIMPKTLLELECNLQYLQYANYVNSYIQLGNSLVAVYVDPSVAEIGAEAFRECNNLTTVSLPENLTSIGDGAFSGCTGLTSISIPDGVTLIDDSTFYECTGLTSISIPDGVTSIGDYAFWRCTSLVSISIPDSVTSIGNDAFEGCTDLTSISIPDGVTSIGYAAFWGCTSLMSISIPDNVMYIGQNVIKYCTNLKSIYYKGEMYSYENIDDLYRSVNN